MKLAAFALSLAPLLAGAAAAQEAQAELTLEHRTLLRCSAAFAIIASEQQRGVASAAAWPPLEERGREFFVQSSARLMDELALDREQISGLLSAEVSALARESAEAADPAALVDGVMQPCLVMLEAAGL